MMIRKIIALALAMTFAFTLFTACSKDDQSEAADKEPIIIGHIADLTGVQANNGESSKRALDFAVEWLGGEFAGREVIVVDGDAANEPSTAVDIARKMVEVDNVVAIFGPTQVGQKSAVAEYTEEVGIPLILYNPTPLYMIGTTNWVVGAGGSTMQLPTVMADYAYNELGYRTIHTVSMDSEGNRSIIGPFVDAFVALGGNVVSQVWAPIPCSDWSPYLVPLSDVDAIGAWASGSDAISLWKAWYELGISEKMPMFAAAMHGGFTDSYVPYALTNMNPAVVDAMLGTYASIMHVQDTQNPANEEFVKAWTEKFGSRPTDGNPGMLAQAMMLFKTALEELDGDTDPDKLVEAMLKIDFIGPDGHLYFDNSNVATIDMHIVRNVRLDDGFNYETVKVYSNVPPTGYTP